MPNTEQGLPYNYTWKLVGFAYPLWGFNPLYPNDDYSRHGQLRAISALYLAVA